VISAVVHQEDGSGSHEKPEDLSGRLCARFPFVAHFQSTQIV